MPGISWRDTSVEKPPTGHLLTVYHACYGISVGYYSTDGTFLLPFCSFNYATHWALHDTTNRT